ncbi:MFS transporter [Streptomyces sp. PSKA30]|uniref:MFS transporter n=1 Tax=Streptomyces sp. PSKA30 TaxID=2874597 RepID=UPI001CD0B17C|nr:MFS transporter [Streptomyces sp. PSKA30]MBZ9644980.1 MFS transporter [Streptomyces sp. PSKA30]
MPESTFVPAQSSGTAAPGRQGWWTVAVVTIATFMLMLDLTVINVALPSVRDDLDADFAGLQWVIDSYALTLAAFLLTAGSLADRFGRRRTFNAGFAVFSLASLACGLAPGITELIIARAVQGVGAAVLFAVGPALIGAAFQGKARSAAFGVFGAGAGLAIAAGPLIGGALASGPGWRWIFLVNVPVGVVATVLGMGWMNESKSRASHPVDWAGLIAFTVGLAAVVYALLRGGADGWTSPSILATGTAGVLFLLAFVVVERRRGAAAMLDSSLFRIRTFTGLSVIAALISAGSMSAIFLLVSYVQNSYGFSPWETGLRFLPMTIALFVMAALGGALTAKVPHNILLFVSCLAPAAGLALVPLTLETSSPWTVLLPCTLAMGVGLGLFNPVRAYLAVGVVEPADAGAASGMNETFQQAGMALGIAALGALFQNRATSAFLERDLGNQFAGGDDLGGQIAAGAVPSLPAGASVDASALAAALQSATVSGLNATLPWCAALCALGAAVALVSIRRSDLHPSAIGAVPGVPPTVESVTDSAS